MPASAPTFGLPKRLCGTLFGAAATALALGACTVSTPLTIESSGNRAGMRDVSVALAIPDTQEAAIRRDFATALSNALGDQNVTLSDSGELLADFAIANGSASVGVQLKPDPQAGEADQTRWISTPRRPKRFDECDAQVLRGTLVLIGRADGGIVYRGKAAMTECEFSKADIDILAQALVEDFVSTLR